MKFIHLTSNNDMHELHKTRSIVAKGRSFEYSTISDEVTAKRRQMANDNTSDCSI
jgi:hypothetical protein